MNTKTLFLKSLRGGVDFGTWRGFWSIKCVLEWSLLLLYWMLNLEHLDAMNEVVGGIYSPQPLSSRWQSLLTMGTPDNHCSLSAACHVSAPVRVWSCWPLEPFVFLLHRTVRWPLTFALWLLSQHCSTLFIWAVDRWHAGSRCSGGSPDSPMNYSGACPKETWEWLVRWLPAWCTGPCPVRHLAVHSQSCSKFDCDPNWNSFLVCVEPYAPEISDI
jgi:hypothetical protein